MPTATKAQLKPTATTTRAAIYVRISEDRTGLEAGVQRQETECRALAKANGWTITTVHKDNDTSASKYGTKARPGYAALLADITSGKIDTLVAWHPDRLYRRLTDLESLVPVVEKSGVHIATVKAGRVDLTTATGRLTARVVGSAASYESEIKSERITSAAEQRARAGKFSGGVRPYGYEKDGMTIRPEEADALALAYEGINAGLTLAEVTRRMPPRPQGWVPQHLRFILLSPRPAGLSSYQGEIVGQALWPAIVSRETWEQTVRILTDPSRRTSPGGAARHLLSGIVTCAKCGTTCRVSVTQNRSGTGTKAPIGNGKRYVYRCPAGHLKRSKTALEDYVTELTMNLLEANGVHRPATSPADDAATTATLQRISALRNRLAEITDDYADATMDRPTYLAASARVKANIEALTATLAPTPVLPATDLTDPLTTDPDGPRAAWARLPLANRRAVMRALWRITLVPVPVGHYGTTPEGVQLIPQF